MSKTLHYCVFLNIQKLPTLLRLPIVSRHPEIDIMLFMVIWRAMILQLCYQKFTFVYEVTPIKVYKQKMRN